MTKNPCAKLLTKWIKATCLVSVTSLILSACSSTPVAAPTNYKAAVKDGYGYSSKKLDTNRYQVLFKATDKTPADTIQQYAVYHAAEIASNNNFTFLEIEKTDVERKAVMAREVVVSNDKPPTFKTDQQCTMSGCEEVAQPMAVPASNDIVKTQINDIYLTITVKMAKEKVALGKNALSVTEILSQSPTSEKAN